jgi:simple sugar transport system permease protein
VIALAVFLNRHPWGLRLRGVGERPEAAESLGVSVIRYRYGAILAGGALCGLAGAQLALGNVTLFSENMTAGRGWIAVVAVLLGRALPVGVLAAALLFGLAEALGFRLQGIGLPQQATDAAPYVVTLLALFLANARWRRRREARS